MAVIGTKNLSMGFGSPPLLEDITVQIEKGERVCLLGRNGVGKSTLLHLLFGAVQPDSGEVWRQKGITVASLPQEVPAGCEGTVFDVVSEGLGPLGKTLSEYNRLESKRHADPSPGQGERRSRLRQILDSENGWALSRKVEEALSRTGLDPKAVFADLSSGMKRRVLFARAVAPSPDVLLLDEPTNHLDIDSITWMEAYLLRYAKTLLFVTHDRAFLKKIATRVLELDRGHLFSYDCDYETYLSRRTAMLSAEEIRYAAFEKALSREEAWIRQGVKARRTRNEGRVRRLMKMREENRARREKTGNIRFDLQEAERTGKLVIEASGISFSYNDTPVIQNFSTLIMRGDKVGIIGPNGAGKTTLLNILLKNINPCSGAVRHGTHLQVAYFDQLRARLDESKSVRDNIAEGNDYLVFNGEKRHVISHLRDFLFSPERCRTPVHVLSGGEKNRLLLAKLFTRPANMIVLDEPTNDLDTETLELLEERLLEFTGTLLLVSHDRAFLNNVVTSTIVFEVAERVTEYAGGYDDWLLQRPEPAPTATPETTVARTEPPSPEPRKLKKLGYMEVRELTALPRRIETLESEQKGLFSEMANPLFYKKEKDEIARAKERLETLENEIEAAYLRWEELEEKKALNA